MFTMGVVVVVQDKLFYHSCRLVGVGPKVEVKARSIMKSTKFIARLLGLLIQLDLANLAAIYAPVTRSMPAIKMDFHSVDSRRFNRPDSRPVIVPI